MSAENVSRLIEATDSFNRGDLDAYLRLVHPDVRFEPVQAELQGSYIGHEGVRSWFADLAEHYVAEGAHVQYSEIRDLEDSVLAIGTLHFTGRSSGLTTDVPVALMVSFRDGLIIRLKDYGDKGSALEAAGLPD